MYKGMELNKGYTLEKLGLFESCLLYTSFNFHWYNAWNSIRYVIALKMGYASIVKVPHERYDEFLNEIQKEIDSVVAVYKEKEE